MNIKKIIIIMLSITLLKLSVAWAVVDEASYIKEAEGQFETANALLNRDGAWPYFNPNDKPTLLYFPASKHLYAFNFNPATHSSWTPWSIFGYDNSKQFESWVKKTGKVDYYFIENGDEFEKNLNIALAAAKKKGAAATAHEVDLFVYKIRHGNDQFMYYQFLNYFKNHASENIKFYIDEHKSAGLMIDDLYQPSNMALIYLELEAVRDYVNTHNIEALKRYIAINRIRVAALSQDAQLYEKNDDAIYGKANYVNWRSKNLTASQYSEKFLSTYQLLDEDDIRFFINNQHLDELSSTFELVKHFNRLIFPAIRLALKDAIDVNVGGTTPVNELSLNEVLEHMYPLNPDQITKLVDDAKVQYHFGQISKKMEALFRLYAQVKHAQLDNYNKSPGIEVIVNIPGHVDYDHIGRLMFPLGNRTMLGEGLVEAIKLPAGGGFITDKKIPYIFIRHINAPQLRTELKFKLSPEAMIKFDGLTNGQKLNAINGYQVFKDKLILNTNEIDINFEGIGSIEKKNGQVVIYLDR